MKFVDSAKIFVRSGKGGDGCSAFLHEKYREFGGPSGGNGGKGGDVVVKGNKGLYTLFDLKLNPHQKAHPGSPGSGKNRYGKNGEDLLLELPIGTAVIDDETDESTADFTKGEPGVEMCLRLDLKLMADVGLVGFPNAGKSTFISKVSAAKPKIADYPFTTLHPNLGTVKTDYFRSFIIADIPGLIEGAAEGKGLGHRFLKHIEHTKILAFLIDCSRFAEQSPPDAYRTLNDELLKYSPDMAEKQKIVLFSKHDLPETDPEELTPAIDFSGRKIFRIILSRL
ncbi:hypothetical protein CHS0354_006930 [Potamilus streckersoni]|uniref:GTPase ObgE n=1 Tax=Potamilus streckersoni TaxID=2493646 RepID=A0AAE0TEL2_9BIVA|nr:hypothetical protein CHS0354_006930 [Potamilus streckersoni]